MAKNYYSSDKAIVFTCHNNEIAQDVRFFSSHQTINQQGYKFNHMCFILMHDIAYSYYFGFREKIISIEILVTLFNSLVLCIDRLKSNEIHFKLI